MSIWLDSVCREWKTLPVEQRSSEGLIKVDPVFGEGLLAKEVAHGLPQIVIYDYLSPQPLPAESVCTGLLSSFYCTEQFQKSKNFELR